MHQKIKLDEAARPPKPSLDSQVISEYFKTHSMLNCNKLY